MPDLWMPGAVKTDVGDHAPCDTQYPAKAIAHITWDKNASAAKPVDLVPFANLKAYFTGGGAGMAPHILWSPFTGEFAQFFPADSRSKSVVDLSGGTRTNRAGKVVLQIEALFFPYCRVDGKVYAKLSDTPCKGWQQLQDWVHSWGVPNTWPMGRPTDFTPHRSESVWESQGGWYGHSQVPENTHQDPGTWPAFVTVTPAKPTPAPAKPKVALAHVVYAAKHDPAAAQGHTTYKSEVLLVERALKAEGLLSGTYVDGSFGTKTKDAYKAWQKKLGYSGTGADGIPGKSSLTKLGTKHGFQVTA
ncbi:peptidoglycan-binding protein [Streptomyces sp. NPDC048288]|uniref:peptidoglycan-binding domain-containing protein n=1 Tax=Streptomyces sp. NPDC048288 TaxID=3365529 RepID=UPI003717C2D6